MSFEELKQRIRRRLFAAQFNPRDSLHALSEVFFTCPDCGGTGKRCRDFNDANGVSGASLEVCVKCDGDGFIERAARQGDEPDA